MSPRTSAATKNEPVTQIKSSAAAGFERIATPRRGIRPFDKARLGLATFATSAALPSTPRPANTADRPTAEFTFRVRFATVRRPPLCPYTPHNPVDPTAQAPTPMLRLRKNLLGVNDMRCIFGLVLFVGLCY